MAERSYRKLFWGLAAAGLVLDQATKYGVFRWLYNGGAGDEREVVPGAFELLARYTGQAGTSPLRTWSGEMLPQVNHGALFGFLDQHVGLANVLFAVISLAAATAIAWWSARPAARRELGLSAALGLILAGTLGNLFDRLVFGGVRDFMHLHYHSFDWPVFNVADCCLVCGAVLLLGQAFFGKSAECRPTPAPAAPQEMAEVR
ncbi:MAG TPA: signal peptidase II [Gemmataceae bacterium]|nr:signal peptidase II [Gemmataceae bacterium]